MGPIAAAVRAAIADDGTGDYWRVEWCEARGDSLPYRGWESHADREYIIMNGCRRHRILRTYTPSVQYYALAVL